MMKTIRSHELFYSTTHTNTTEFNTPDFNTTRKDS